MAQFTRDISVKLDDGETERFVVQTFRNDAVKVGLSATGQPYDVDIQTSDEHPQNDAGFNQDDYTSSLPLGTETYTDTNNHITATEAIGVSIFVSITNNAGQREEFTGTIETHSQSAPSTAQEFATQNSGNRASAYRDGKVLGNSESFNADTVRTQSRVSDAVIWNDSGTYRAESRNSEIASDDDLGSLLNTVISDLGQDSSIQVAPGEYEIATTINVNKRIELVCKGPQNGRFNQDDGATRFIWTGGSSPVFEVGGTSNDLVRGTHFEGFLLKPDTPGNGSVGILFDGSRTRDSNRVPIHGNSMKDVHIRNFGTHQMHILGNVFDYQFTKCGFHGDAGKLVKHERVDSKNVDFPNYGEYYSCAWHSGSQGTWAIHGQFRGNIIGGFASTDNGIQMSFRSSVRAWHMESAASGPNAIGIEVTDAPAYICPRQVTGCAEGIVVNDPGNDPVTIAGGAITGDTNSVRVEEGSVQILTGADIKNGIEDNQELGDVRNMNNIGYVPGLEATLFEITDVPISYGNGLREFDWYDYDDNNTELIGRVRDSGGVLDERLRMTGREDIVTRTWTNVEHNFGDMPIFGISDIQHGTQRTSDPTTTDLDDGESMLYISDGSADVQGSEGDYCIAVNDSGTIKGLILAKVSNMTNL